MTVAPVYTLSDGCALPAAGFGTYPLDDAEAEIAVRNALELGYRLIDTAASYGNETAVGRGIATSEVPREDVFVTSKLRGRDQGYDKTLAAFRQALDRLGLDYLDAFLIHWPLPRVDAYTDSWRAMIRLREEGLVRSIGVSNFTTGHLERLREETGVVPAVNQIEVHPYFPQREQREAHAAMGIRTESWRPLGKGTELLDEPVVAELAQRHGVTAAQVVLRWHVELGNVPLPKSASPERRGNNLDIFGFTLEPAEVAALSALERGRLGGDPTTHEEF